MSISDILFQFQFWAREIVPDGIEVVRFDNFRWKGGYFEWILMNYDVISLIINPAFSIEMANLK